MKRTTAAAFLLLVLNAAAPAMAQAPQGSPSSGTSAPGTTSSGESWPAVKCARYRQGYRVAIDRQGKQGLGAEFLARHDAFLASDCAGQHDVCPRSKEELDLANTLVVLGMNQGMASTFMPFACRK